MVYNQIFESLLNNRVKFEFLKDLSLDEVEFLKNIVRSVNKKLLFEYQFHGVYHSQKVLLFGYLLSRKINLPDNDRKILIDAFILHDCGRVDDSEDPFHGLAGANKLAVSFKNDEFYSQNQNLNMLCAIVDAHSVDDSRAYDIALNYDIQDDNDIERFSCLYKILKDADALDRTRFPKSISESIKESYLRFDFSKKLISFAYQVNQYYIECINKEYFETYKERYMLGERNVSFFHSIGWDFSKFESILEHGILSEYAASLRKISISRNFCGNNSKMWISVVSDCNFKEEGKAYKKFLMNGIDFYCITSALFEGEKKESKAQSNALPIKSGEYDDESFVFYEVPREDILVIAIPTDKMNCSLEDLYYLGCANSFSVIGDRTACYMQYIKNITDLDMDCSEVNKKIEKLKELQLSFSSKCASFQQENLKSFIDEIDCVVQSINQDICRCMDYSFSMYFGLNEGEHATVGMMITDILHRKNIEFQMNTDNSFVFLNLDKSLKEYKL